MRRAITIFFLLAVAVTRLTAQTPLRDAWQRSHQSFVYRISADSAEKYIRQGLASPDAYLDRTPFQVWPADSAMYRQLPAGNYFILSVRGNEIRGEYYCQSDLRVFPINDLHRVQFEVKDSLGDFATGAHLWMDGKEIAYNNQTRSFRSARKRPDNATLRITIPGDTLFLQLGITTVQGKGWQQWWENIRYTRMGRIFTWPVTKLKHLFNDRYRNHYSRGKNRSSSARNGYMLFNKPKYQPGDTLRLKAFVVNKHGKPYRKKLFLHLEYTQRNEFINKEMGSIRPQPAGAYTNEFVLGDSLDSDKSYTISLVGRKNRAKMKGNFKIEDYLLDEIATYGLRSAREDYFPQDTLRFYTSAKDANGLSLMDGQVRLYLLATTIKSFYPDREYIADTLWQGEKPLSVDGETAFEVPSAGFPKADLALRAVAEFRNSNNELHEEEAEVNLINSERAIHIRRDGAYITAEYLENGRSVAAPGFLGVTEDDREKAIHFPYRARLDNYTSDYFFSIKDDSKKILCSKNFELQESYTLSFTRLQEKDSAGFYLHNPARVAVHYLVSYGNNTIYRGADTAEWISWKSRLDTKKQYRVAWNYIWAGEERNSNGQVVVLDKVLQGTITGARVVYPGQHDTIGISVKDYKGRPAIGMNLTAVSYNSQFKKDIHVPEPPLLQRFRTRRGILSDEYELQEVGEKMDFILGQHPSWRKKFGLDTMAYYQLLFPKDGYHQVSYTIDDFTPQLALHIVKDGIPQEIYMLYINREFTWYNGVTDKGKYAFSVEPGYVQAGIRLRDQYVEIDSLYIQPFYKHDISIDLDHLPGGATVERRDIFYTPEERGQIERQVWQLNNDGLSMYGYVWQAGRVVRLESGIGNRLVGPFVPNDSIQYYRPGIFDIKFPFEAGYQYSLRPAMTRLEKKNIFPGNEKVYLLPKTATWILGDTLDDLPVMRYEKKSVEEPFLKANENDDMVKIMDNAVRLRIELPKDSVFLFSILYSRSADTTITYIYNHSVDNFYTVLRGRYDLVLVTSGLHYLVARDVDILPNGTTCLRFSQPVYAPSNSFIDSLRSIQAAQSEKMRQAYFKNERTDRERTMQLPSSDLPEGNGSIAGIVADEKGGAPIPGVSIIVKGYSNVIQAGVDGHFRIDHIRNGQYTLVYTRIGYLRKEVIVEVAGGIIAAADVRLTMGSESLKEVVVIGYGTRLKRELTGAIVSINGTEITQSLQGKVSGLSVMNSGADIVIRGSGTIASGSRPIYVVNGVVMDELPEGFDMNQAQVSTMQGSAAISLYGTRAAAGVIVVSTTGFLPEKSRDTFRDYAFWQPNLVTDKNGEAHFAVTYPDNIAGWETYFIGMDRKKRILKTTAFTKSFKPVLAQLSTPRFLVEGDSSEAIGKIINYASDAIGLTTTFHANGITRSSDRMLEANSSMSEPLRLTAASTDTISAEYSIRDAAGYSDGEIRRIPVFAQGDEEANGLFAVLDKDTSFFFLPQAGKGKVTLYAQNNTLDVLLDEINHLQEYPFACMEQTASKLMGLLMEKRIRASLNEIFKGEKDIQRMLGKLQHAQQFDGGWSWWEGGREDLVVTNYIIRALLLLRGDASTANTTRNGLLYLQNRLSRLGKDDLINSLFTLSETEHEMSYNSYLDSLIFDSLTVHQQWQVIRIRQNLRTNISGEIRKMLNKAEHSMMGGIHWGNASCYWQNNEMATTTLAFMVLVKEKGNKDVLGRIVQYFLEQRQRGRWMNTVESASVVTAILPFVMENSKNFKNPSILTISSDTILHVDRFPFSCTIKNTGHRMDIHKSGGGLVYFTVWQRVMNRQPLPVTNNFIIDTWFERAGRPVTILKAGEKITMKIKIQVLKDAEYVQLSVPIPAGCTYAEKKQAGYTGHREFQKDRMNIFVEKMSAGVSAYEIELEPRYTGHYLLNPARAELMYFPVLYGRNETRRVSIEK